MNEETRLLIFWFIVGVLLGLAAGLLLCILPPLDASAQGVGIWTTSATGARTNCTQVTNPVRGQTFCFNQSTNELMVYNGAFFAPVTATGAGTNVAALIGSGQTNYVNYSYGVAASGTTQQVGTAHTIAGAASQLIPGSSFRIALYAGAETGPGGEAVLPFNVSMSAHAVHPVATTNAIQVTLANNQASSALNCVPPACYIGTSMVSTGSGIASYAFVVGGTGQWQQGYEVDQGAIATGGFAFNYKGDGTNGAARITSDANLQVASGVSFNATQVLFNGSSPASNPRCTNNCGTAPAVVGTNTAMRVTMGATGTPRSPFLVLFNGSWNAAPSCIAQLDTATTTTVSVTNSTTTGVEVNTVIGPSQGGVFSIHCIGVG